MVMRLTPDADLQNADWIKPQSWDLPRTLDGLLAHLRDTNTTVEHFLTLPAAVAMPEDLRGQLVRARNVSGLASDLKGLVGVLGGLESKAIRRVRDPEYWGKPFGTIITPGMKPMGVVRRMGIPTMKTTDDDRIYKGSASIERGIWEFTVRARATKVGQSYDGRYELFARPKGSTDPADEFLVRRWQTLGSVADFDEYLEQSFVAGNGLHNEIDTFVEARPTFYEPTREIPKGLPGSDRGWVEWDTADAMVVSPQLTHESTLRLTTPDQVTVDIRLRDTVDGTGRRGVVLVDATQSPNGLPKHFQTIPSQYIVGEDDRDVLAKLMPIIEPVLQAHDSYLEKRASTDDLLERSTRNAQASVEPINGRELVDLSSSPDITVDEKVRTKKRLQEWQDAASDDDVAWGDLKHDQRVKNSVEAGLHQPIIDIMRDDPASDLYAEEVADEYRRYYTTGYKTDPYISGTFQFRLIENPRLFNDKYLPELNLGDTPPNDEQRDLGYRRAALLTMAGRRNETTYAAMHMFTRHEFLRLQHFSDTQHEHTDIDEDSIVDLYRRLDEEYPDWLSVGVARDTHKYVSTWASSSADHNPVSLALQTAVSDILVDGAELDHLEIDKNARQQRVQDAPFLNAFVVAVYQRTQRDLDSAGIKFVPAHRGMSVSASQYEEMTGNSYRDDSSSEDYLDWLRANLREQVTYIARLAYETQHPDSVAGEASDSEKLAALLAEESRWFVNATVPLYDGAESTFIESIRNGLADSIPSVEEFTSQQALPDLPSTHVTIGLQPVSSFSTSLSTAEGFRGDQDVQVVMADVMLPKDRVWSLYTTGPGCTSESEIVALGGKFETYASFTPLRNSAGYEYDEAPEEFGDVDPYEVLTEELEDWIENADPTGEVRTDALADWVKKHTAAGLGSLRKSTEDDDILGRHDAYKRMRLLEDGVRNSEGYTRLIERGRALTQMELLPFDVDRRGIPVYFGDYEFSKETQMDQQHVTEFYWSLIGSGVTATDATEIVYRTATDKWEDNVVLPYV